MKLIDTYTPKRLELLNEFNKVVGYKINIQTSVAFLYNNNEISESKKKKPLKITLKYLGMNLTKEAKDLYCENYRTLMKETEDDSKKWKDIQQSSNLMQSLSKYP